MSSLSFAAAHVKETQHLANHITSETQTATAIPQPPETVRWLPAQTTLPDCFADHHATHATTINKHVMPFCWPLPLNPSTHQEAR
jgi:hypothetical protein